jgi:hypothetical protein
MIWLYVQLFAGTMFEDITVSCISKQGNKANRTYIQSYTKVTGLTFTIDHGKPVPMMKESVSAVLVVSKNIQNNGVKSAVNCNIGDTIASTNIADGKWGLSALEYGMLRT